MSDEQAFTILSEEEERHICAQYGLPSESNQPFIAVYFSKVSKFAFSNSEKKFYGYRPERGIWRHVNTEELLMLLASFLHWASGFWRLPRLALKRTPTFLNGVTRFLKGCSAKADEMFSKKLWPPVIHCMNTMLVFHPDKGWVPTPFSPDFYSRNFIPIDYVPGADAPRFLDELLRPAVSPDNIDLLRLYAGQCLLGVNVSQTFLLLTGSGGSGKSTFVNVIEAILGPENCVEFRSAHAGGRFELGRLEDKKLLTAKDVRSDFLLTNGATKIKSLTGNDKVSTERKNSNEVVDIQGCFNLIITSNPSLRIRMESDLDAWRRRTLWVPFMRTPPKERISGFDQVLMDKEGSGILNWMLSGAADLLRMRGVISLTAAQRDCVHELLNLSTPFECFAAGHIFRTSGASITTEEAIRCFGMFCARKDWPSIPEREAQHLFNEWMRQQGAPQRTDIKRNGHSKRGYSGFQIR